MTEERRLSRGGMFHTRIAYVKRMFGTDGVEKLRKKMEDMGYGGPWGDNIKVGEWYPHEWDLLFLKAFRELFGKEEFVKFARAAQTSGGVQGLFFKWPDSPGELVERSGELWRLFYSFGRLEGHVDGNRALLRGYGLSDDPIFCEFLTLYFGGLLEKIGAKGVSVEHTRCTHRGDALEEWSISWDNTGEALAQVRDIRWSEALSTGIDEIDRQHRQFIEILREINENVHAGDREMLLRVLRFMDHYAHWHFASEEKYMKRYEYGEYAAHNREHLKFYEYTQKMIGKAEEGIDAHLIYSINTYLIDWLINHIMVVDMKFAKYLREIGAELEEERMPEDISRNLKTL